jgi:apolipoprotein N-acyltransferase
VPFGEYVPLQDLFRLFRGLAAGMVEGAFVPGPRPRVLGGLESLGSGHAPAVLICYEVIYPSLVRRSVRDGARLLINITNDAWYGRTSAPHQFLAVAAMRSAEHGIPMIRAANTGVSGVVDASGTVGRETPIFERWALPVEIPAPRAGRTLYTRAGDWVVWASWIGLIGIGGRRIVRRDER